MVLRVETVSVEACCPEDSVTVGGLNDSVGPLATTGRTVEVSVTLPEKPSRLDRLIVEVPDDPTVTVRT